MSTLPPRAATADLRDRTPGVRARSGVTRRGWRARHRDRLQRRHRRRQRRPCGAARMAGTRETGGPPAALHALAPEPDGAGRYQRAPGAARARGVSARKCRGGRGPLTAAAASAESARSREARAVARLGTVARPGTVVRLGAVARLGAARPALRPLHRRY